MTETLGWRWIFFVNVPFGIVALVFGLRFLREHTRADRRAASTSPGFVLSGFGLASIALRHQRGTTRRVDEPVGARRWASPASPRSSRLVYVETHVAAPDARPAPVQAAAVPGDEPRDGVRHGQLPRPDVRAAAVPAGPARPRSAAQRPDDVPAGHRHPHLLADRRAALPADRAAPTDHRRHARRRRLDVAACCSSAWRRTSGGSASSCFLRGFAMGFCFVSSQAASYAEIQPADNGRASAIFSTQRQMAVVHRRRPDGHRAVELHDAQRRHPTDRERALTGYHWTFAVCVALALIVGPPGVPRSSATRTPARRCSPSARRRPRHRCRPTADRLHRPVCPAVRADAASARRVSRRGRGRRGASPPSTIEPAPTPSSAANGPHSLRRDPDVDHRRLGVLDERRAARAVGAG